MVGSWETSCLSFQGFKANFHGQNYVCWASYPYELVQFFSVSRVSKKQKKHGAKHGYLPLQKLSSFIIFIGFSGELRLSGLENPKNWATAAACEFFASFDFSKPAAFFRVVRGAGTTNSTERQANP